MIEAIIAGLRAITWPEAASVVLGLVYLLMVVWRSRWGWIFGGMSSAILCYLAIHARLPMQAVLQVYYVGMSAYGFWHWSKQDASQQVTVSTWPLKFHIIACVSLLVVSALSARFLAEQTHAAWPLLDSFTTWGSLFTTWLVARAKLENWLYWIVIDALLAYIFAMQELYFVALLMAVYVGIVMGGYFKWLRLYRISAQTS